MISLLSSKTKTTLKTCGAPERIFGRFFDKLIQEIYQYTLPKMSCHMDFEEFSLHWFYINLCTLRAHFMTLNEGSVRSVRPEVKKIVIEDSSTTYFIVWNGKTP